MSESVLWEILHPEAPSLFWWGQMLGLASIFFVVISGQRFNYGLLKGLIADLPNTLENTRLGNGSVTGRKTCPPPIAVTSNTAYYPNQFLLASLQSTHRKSCLYIKLFEFAELPWDCLRGPGVLANQRCSFQDPALAGERICQGFSGRLKVAVRALASIVKPSH